MRHSSATAHALSLSRVAIGVVLLIWLAGPSPLPSVAVVALFTIGALSDWADGTVARRFVRPRSFTGDGGTELGKWIDAGSDFLFFAAILIGLAAHGTLAVWVLASFLTRELLMYGMLRPLLLSHGLDAGARMAGKVKTVLQFAATALGLLLHLAVRADAIMLSVARTITTAALGAAVAASFLSLRWYWMPLAARWSPQLRHLLVQSGVTLLALLSVQTLVWLLVRLSPELDQLFSLTITLWLAIAAGGVVWRRNDFRLLAGSKAGDWLPHLSLPNIMTLFRFSSIPTLTLLLGSGMRPGSGWLLLAFAGLAFASDLFDGRLARRQGLTSRIGKNLDSATDYAALLAIAGLLAWVDAVPAWLWALITLRLALNASATLVIVARFGIDAAVATWWGKVSVAALMIYFSLELLWRVVVAPGWVAPSMVWIERAVGAVVVVSLADKVRYVARMFRNQRAAGHRRSVALADRSAGSEHVGGRSQSERT